MNRFVWTTLAAVLLAGCAATEEPEPRSAPRGTASPEALRTMDRMLVGTGKMSNESPAQRQSKCLAKVAASPLCPPPVGQTRAIGIRLLLDERYAQRVPNWEQRLDKTFACVNRFFVPAGIRWEIVNMEGWTPGPLRGDIRVDRARLAALRPPDLKSMVAGVVVWDEQRIKARRMGKRLADCTEGTCAFVAWPSAGTECLTWAKNLARQAGARLMPGRRWLVARKYLRYFNLGGQATAVLHQHYQLHPRNLAALKLARAARYTPQGLRLPNDCYERLRALDRCYFGGDPQVVARVASCKRGKPSACRALGDLYARGHGVAKNLVTAAGYYRTACTWGDKQACVTLARLQSAGKGEVRDPTRAAALLRTACTGGHMGACVDLAGAYRKGSGVPRDQRQAVALAEKACQAKHLGGCNVLASMISHGQGAPKDQARAARLFRLSCNSGDLRGCYSLSLMVYNGQGVKKDRRAAVALLQEGCNRGDAKSCNALAGFFWAGQQGQKKDRPRAAALYARSCEAGYSKACLTVGAMYRHGDGIPTDLAKAQELLHRACQARHGDACIFLAEMHLAGQVAGGSPKAAAAILNMCCGKGHAGCCQSLASELRTAKRLPRDPRLEQQLNVKSAALYRGGCRVGKLAACQGLARLQWNGWGVPRDRAAALAAYRRGCQRRYAGSCYSLGLILTEGLGGVARDATKGLAAMKLACERRHHQACRWLRGKQ